MNSFKTLDNLSAQGKIVLLRADLNVPMKNGEVTDTTRISRLVPTILELSGKGAKVVILSHFGRPDGKADPAFSLLPVGKALEKTLGRPVAFAGDCIGPIAEKSVSSLNNGDILLLENVRFHAEEEKDDAVFAQKIAALGQAYVNDAFSAAHRAHATTHGIARLLPAYAGRLMEEELKALEAALEKPQRPVVAIVGGAKISTKLALLNNLVTKIDTLVLGGGMANTFLFALGKDMGKSLCEKDMADNARLIIQTAQKNNCRILLPVDAATAKEFRANPPVEYKSVDTLTSDDMFLDIGPKTVAEIEAVLKNAKTVLWNGPLGAFETEPFDKGTMAVANIVANLTQKNNLISVAGGGDTVAALSKSGTTEHMSYVSTAGGAFLEWMEGKELPGVTALRDAACSKAASSACSI